jgi:hypothetical protein
VAEKGPRHKICLRALQCSSVTLLPKPGLHTIANVVNKSEWTMRNTLGLNFAPLFKEHLNQSKIIAVFIYLCSFSSAILMCLRQSRPNKNYGGSNGGSNAYYAPLQNDCYIN